jgi:hypothetical protein
MKRFIFITDLIFLFIAIYAGFLMLGVFLTNSFSNYLFEGRSGSAFSLLRFLLDGAKLGIESVLPSNIFTMFLIKIYYGLEVTILYFLSAYMLYFGTTIFTYFAMIFKGMINNWILKGTVDNIGLIGSFIEMMQFTKMILYYFSIKLFILTAINGFSIPIPLFSNITIFGNISLEMILIGGLITMGYSELVFKKHLYDAGKISVSI